MKKRAKLLAAVLIGLSLGTTIQVSAADDRLGTVVDGSLLTDEMSAESNVSSLARGTILNNGTGRISIKGARTINAGGTTTAYRTVDRIAVNLFVQKLTGNTWVNAVTVPSKTLYNTYHVSQSQNYTVSGGYYYRVRGNHIAVDGEIYESTTSATDGIWID